VILVVDQGAAGTRLVAPGRVLGGARARRRRTALLWDAARGAWSPEACARLGLHPSVLPPVRPSTGRLARSHDGLPVLAVASRNSLGGDAASVAIAALAHAVLS